LLDLTDQNIRLERLGDVVIRSRSDRALLVKGFKRSGQQDDRHRGDCRFRPQGGAHLIAILVRHDKIQQHEIWPHLAGLSDGLLPAARLDEDKVFLAESQFDDLLDRDAVIRDQNSGRHAILLSDRALSNSVTLRAMLSARAELRGPNTPRRNRACRPLPPRDQATSLTASVDVKSFASSSHTTGRPPALATPRTNSDLMPKIRGGGASSLSGGSDRICNT
jgi:hypothetical protein